MLIDKNKEGAWRIKDIINDSWVTRLYYFYTKKEALELFKEEFKNRRAL